MLIHRGTTLLSVALLTIAGGPATASQGPVVVKKQLVETVNARLAAIPHDPASKSGVGASTSNTHPPASRR